MKAKIAYVLVADPGNYYLEQTWMSAYTARKHNPDTEVVLVTDRQTLEAWPLCLRVIVIVKSHSHNRQ